MTDPTKWNDEALDTLGEKAMAYGRTWAALKESFLAQGMQKTEAETQAHMAATMAALAGKDPEDGEGACPLCGGSGEAP